MQAFALSQPFHSLQSPRLALVCNRRPLFPSASPARATLNHPDNSPDPTVTPAMTATASRVEEHQLSGISTADGNRIATVRAQMEFWFSPSNLRRDWYLRRQMDDDGWLDPAVFLLFNKIKNLNANIQDIILACQTSDELEVSLPGAESFGDNAGQTRVRRSPQLPGFMDNDDMEFERSFLVSGIPLDSTIETLQDLFQQFAPVSYVRIYRNKNFPDSPRALICFPDVKSAEDVSAKFASGTPEGFQGMSLRRRTRPNAAGTEQSANKFLQTTVCELNGLPLQLDWRKLRRELDNIFERGTGQNIRYLMYSGDSDHCFITLRDGEQVKEFVDELVLNGIELGGKIASIRVLCEDELEEYWRTATEHQAKRKARKAESDARKEQFGSDSVMSRKPTGVIIRVDGLSQQVTWRQLRAELGQLSPLIYLNHDANETYCFARFGSSEDAEKVAKRLTAGEDAVVLCGCNVEAHVLQGEEEIEYWTRAEEAQRARQNGSDSWRE